MTANRMRRGIGVPRSRSLPVALALAGGLVLVVAILYLVSHGRRDLAVALPIGAAAGLAAAYLMYTIEPVYVFTLAIVLTPFAGNWKYLGLPGPAAPDRLLFVAGSLVVIYRAYGNNTLPRPRFAVPHVAMVLALLFAAGSALSAHDLLTKGPGLQLVETFGLLPYITFWLAPVVFPTARERAILLTGLVAMGAYLGLTALFETTGPKALVFPRYILDPSITLHYGRARGPFADAVANGVGLYVGAIASAIAFTQWQARHWRIGAAAIGVLCIAGALMTLERTVWIAVAVATLVTLFSQRQTRRVALPLVGAVAVVTAAIVLAVPSVRSHVTGRLNDPNSLYDRQNLQQTAFNMIDAKPLFGFGWNQYLKYHFPYVQQNKNIPLTAGSDTDLHSAYLEYAVGLGLVGASLWLLPIILGAGASALRRAPPELEPWRLGLLALLIFYLICELGDPAAVFVNQALWSWAGVVAVCRYPPTPIQHVN